MTNIQLSFHKDNEQCLCIRSKTFIMGYIKEKGSTIDPAMPPIRIGAEPHKHNLPSTNIPLGTEQSGKQGP